MCLHIFPLFELNITFWTLVFSIVRMNILLMILKTDPCCKGVSADITFFCLIYVRMVNSLMIFLWFLSMECWNTMVTLERNFLMFKLYMILLKIRFTELAITMRTNSFQTGFFSCRHEIPCLSLQTPWICFVYKIYNSHGNLDDNCYDVEHPFHTEDIWMDFQDISLCKTEKGDSYRYKICQYSWLRLNLHLPQCAWFYAQNTDPHLYSK